MLVVVLNCYQRDEVKWRNMSGQVIDLLLPLLANQKVKRGLKLIMLSRVTHINLCVIFIF